MENPDDSFTSLCADLTTLGAQLIALHKRYAALLVAVRVAGEVPSITAPKPPRIVHPDRILAYLSQNGGILPLRTIYRHFGITSDAAINAIEDLADLGKAAISFPINPRGRKVPTVTLVSS